jgi:probable rRNA maturation factor
VAPVSDIQFHFQEVSPVLRNRQKLKDFLVKQSSKEKQTILSLNYIFCTDEYLLDVNRRFLNHDYYTDIITFDLSGSESGISGEIYISTDRVRENAKSYGVTMQQELHRVIFHGVLHLCGYRDKTKKDQEFMRAAEDRWLKAYFK